MNKELFEQFMTHKGFTQDEMREAFEEVQNPNDWRAPIFTVISREQKEVVEAAIEFFTATTPTFAERGECLEVRAVGYRNGPAGP